MKVVILCGGLGTRLREETEFRPKPMIPIGDMPILLHIMKYYAAFGHKDFILCLGYKGELIKEYFRNYQWNACSVTIKLGPQQTVEYHNGHSEDDWTVTLLDTGQNTMTGGRLLQALPYVDDTFLLTYGDGLTNSNINKAIAHHQALTRLVTLTAVKPPGRFGDLVIGDDGLVSAFTEKTGPQAGWVNGGFFVMQKAIGEYLNGPACVLEQEPMKMLAANNEVTAYFHPGFWQCMDTYREQQLLNQLWNSGQAPWRIWT